MDYDVLILGGGLIGCAVAYELSKYNLNIALIEKDYDIADDIALSNTSIVFNGMECGDSLTSQLEFMGNNMMEEVTQKFKVPFKRRPSIIVSEDEEFIDDLYKIGKEKQKDIKILTREELIDLQSDINKDYNKALYFENTGVVCPYDLALAYGEVAFDNNVNFKLEEEVLDIKKESKGFKVITNKNKFTCKIVINTTPNENYCIDNKKEKEKECNLNIRYVCINREANLDYSNLIFSVTREKEHMLAIPTLNGETIGAMVTAKDIDNATVLEELKTIIPNIDNKYISTFYNNKYYDRPFFIDDSGIDIGYIKVSNKHYAIVTMAPAIAKIISETVINKIKCRKKKDFIDRRREYYRFRDLTNEERNEIIKLNPSYGKIICFCEKVTEGEIIDAIRRPLGARTLEGIKRRTGAAVGKCQGAQCMNKILFILARETNKPLTEIVKDSKNSIILLNRIKEFDTM